MDSTDLPECETLRRQRVSKGWAFRNWTAEEEVSILNYLSGGPVPKEWAAMDAAEPLPVKKSGRWK